MDMDLRFLRPRGEEPPIYSQSSDFFTIVVHSGKTVNYFDLCHIEAMSMIEIDDMCKVLELDPSKYDKKWEFPSGALDIRHLKTDTDVLQMVAALPADHIMHVYLEEHVSEVNGVVANEDVYVVEDFHSGAGLEGVDLDDPRIDEFEMLAELAAVQAENEASQAVEERILVAAEEVEGLISENESDDEDCIPPDIVLSDFSESEEDYEPEEVDVSIWRQMEEKFKKLDSLVLSSQLNAEEFGMLSDGEESLHSLEDREKEESDEDFERNPVKTKNKCRVKPKFPEFNSEVDMANPTLVSGLIFASQSAMKEAIRMYSRMNCTEIFFKINDTDRMLCKCQKGCSWRLWGSWYDKRNPRDDSWQIKSYEGKHSCLRTMQNHHLTANFLADYYLKKFQVCASYSISSLADDILQGFGIEASLSKCSRAKKKALTLVNGNYAAQYGRIYDYLNEVRLSNPGTTTIVKLEDNYFLRMYMCLESLKRGWKVGCRPIICMDGCFLKGYYQGHLLTAVGLDADDCIYPIAWAVVESENFSSWLWFLEMLKDDLDIGNNFNIVFMSDRQKGLCEAILSLFGDAEHKNCVRHIYANFKLNPLFKGKILKDALWKAARATSMTEYKAAMEELMEIDKDAHDWLARIDPKTWSKAHFSARAKSDILLNNHSESFNKMILDARGLPILTLFETIRTQVMHRICKKNEEAEKFKGPLCPKIQKRVNKLIELSIQCTAMHAGAMKWQVTCGPQDQYCVDISKMECSCRRWQLTGIPCKHAISVFRRTKERPEAYVNQYYHSSTQMQIYTHYINPVPGPNQWGKELTNLSVRPPLVRRPVGRPAKKRRKGPDSPVKDGKVSRAGTYQICGKCKKVGHNARTYRGEVGANRPINRYSTRANTNKKGKTKKRTAASTSTPPTTQAQNSGGQTTGGEHFAGQSSAFNQHHVPSLGIVQQFHPPIQQVEPLATMGRSKMQVKRPRKSVAQKTSGSRIMQWLGDTNPNQNERMNLSQPAPTNQNRQPSATPRNSQPHPPWKP